MGDFPKAVKKKSPENGRFKIGPSILRYICVVVEGSIVRFAHRVEGGFRWIECAPLSSASAFQDQKSNGTLAVGQVPR